MFTEERQLMILMELERQGTVSVQDLADRFQVSTVTIRNDLNALAKSGRIRRTHGGAMLSEIFQRAEQSPNWTRRVATLAEEKQAIGRAAAALLHSGETIMLDSGTTTFQIASNLGALDALDCVTNDIRVATAAAAWPNVRVVLSGGFTRGDLALWGDHALRTILAVGAVDRTFVSCTGLSLEGGLHALAMSALPCKQAMIDAAREVTVVVDSSKVNAPQGHPFAGFDRVHRLITGATAPARFVEALRDRGIEVILV